MANEGKNQEKIAKSWKWVYQVAAFLAALVTIYAGLRSCLSDEPPPPTTTPALTQTNPATPIPSSTITLTPTNSATPTQTGTITPTPTPLLKLIKLTSPVKLGEEAEAVVQTLPGETCTIAYTTPGGNVSTSPDLDPIQADVNGMCAWKWHISAQTTPGDGRVVIRVGFQELERPIRVLEK